MRGKLNDYYPYREVKVDDNIFLYRNDNRYYYYDSIYDIINWAEEDIYQEEDICEWDIEWDTNPKDRNYIIQRIETNKNLYYSKHNNEHEYNDVIALDDENRYTVILETWRGKEVRFTVLIEISDYLIVQNEESKHISYCTLDEVKYYDYTNLNINNLKNLIN